MDTLFLASGRGAAKYDDEVVLRVLGFEVFGHHIALSLLVFTPLAVIISLIYVLFVIWGAIDEDEDAAADSPLPLLSTK